MTEIADKLLKAIDKAIANVTRYDMEATEQNKATWDATQDGMICGLMTAKEIIMIVDLDYSKSKESEQQAAAAVKINPSERNLVERNPAERNPADLAERRGRKTPINRNTLDTLGTGK